MAHPTSPEFLTEDVKCILCLLLYAYYFSTLNDKGGGRISLRVKKVQFGVKGSNISNMVSFVHDIKRFHCIC